MHWLAERAVEDHGANQDKEEFSILLELIDPAWTETIVLEIGADRGGTLFAWSRMAQEVVCITKHIRSDRIFDGHGAIVIEGDSTDQNVRNEGTASAPLGKFGMVFVDGAHDYVTARRDISWARTITPNGLVVVHDIYPDFARPEQETYLAWQLFRENLPTIEICRKHGETPGYGIIWPAG